MHIEDSLLVLLSFSTWRKEQEQPRNTSPRERMIPWEVDRVKAVLRWRNSILLSLSLSLTRKSRAMRWLVRKVLQCVFAADADYASCHRLTEWKRERARESERRREATKEKEENDRKV